MKKLKLLAVAVTSVALVSIIGCQKGDTGPQGPKGPAGPDSVIYSPWVAINTPFVGLGSANDSVFEQVISSNAITQSILDNGVIIAYIKDQSGNVSDISNYSTILDVYYSVGKMTIDAHGVDITGAGYVRFVAIPGAILATNSLLKTYTKEQLKSVDYATISKALGISSSKASN
ncbi:MAG: hypothetical protein JST47_06105 [Bacteroidetes bacterium]|nr:hypothetical protein [Bacteroidota bacterium]MBS1973190.1 hypothetical protein [Bacteroidota bacterium]